jgi:hypothetical protein
MLSSGAPVIAGLESLAFADAPYLEMIWSNINCPSVLSCNPSWNAFDINLLIDQRGC